jgi:hypothetical protein
MVDLDAGIPFEGRGGDIVVPPDPADRRVWIEAGQDGVPDHARGLSLAPSSGLPAISPSRGEITPARPVDAPFARMAIGEGLAES